MGKDFTQAVINHLMTLTSAISTVRFISTGLFIFPKISMLEPS
jgi:hypothetical protein